MPEVFLDPNFISSVMAIIVIDLVLSGDNAVVIALAARRLPAKQQTVAIVVGGGGAIVLRITFTALAALLLTVPLLQAIGGIVLCYIAYHLLVGRSDQENFREAKSFREAIGTIILADVIMSLDNILAIGGIARGDVPLLIFGLVLSMAILLAASRIAIQLITRFPILSYLGSAVLGYAGGQMIVEDRWLHTMLEQISGIEIVVPLVLAVGIPAIGYFVAGRKGQLQAGHC